MASAQDSKADVAITLERTPCFGTCPVYTVSILEDGTVIYNGTNFVDIEGEQITQIEPETVDMMLQAFADAGYFEWDEEYTEQTVSDLPTVITSVTRDGATHQITRYAGDTAPLALPFLEQWIDIVANTAMWTGVQAEPSTVYNGMSTPVITLQRTPCFGFCPVYNLAIFEDGTAVYTGIANVDKLGVIVYQVEDFVVESLIQQATALGYFDWQESYETMVMTDQVTVITTIQTDEQYKRIVRYGGDPNAPVGLTWIEDNIGQYIPQ